RCARSRPSGSPRTWPGPRSASSCGLLREHFRAGSGAFARPYHRPDVTPGPSLPNTMRAPPSAPRTTTASALPGASCLLAAVTTAEAQELEPRAYSNLPIGLNFVAAGYAYSKGGL